MTWIDSILNDPTQGDEIPTLLSSANVSAGYADDSNAVIDAASKTISVALPAGSQFYQLRACVRLTINSIQVQNGNLVLTYQ